MIKLFLTRVLTIILINCLLKVRIVKRTWPYRFFTVIQISTTFRSRLAHRRWNWNWIHSQCTHNTRFTASTAGQQRRGRSSPGLHASNAVARQNSRVHAQSYLHNTTHGTASRFREFSCKDVSKWRHVAVRRQKCCQFFEKEEKLFFI